MIFVFGLFFFPQEPVGFLYISEIFPSHIRAKGIAVGLGAINICEFRTFPPLCAV
jgi:hypothetical protein